MSNKKIFSDQLEIAIKLSGINVMTKEEFVEDYERNYGKMVTETKFPNILQIYDKYSKNSKHGECKKGKISSSKKLYMNF